MILHVDSDDPVPSFEQIRAQIASMIATGVLPEGTQLPPIRQLAADLDLAPGTVARAYRELEQHGLIVTRGRRGTIVGRTGPPAVPSNSHLEDAARTFAMRAYQTGANSSAALEAVRSAFEHLLDQRMPKAVRRRGTRRTT